MPISDKDREFMAEVADYFDSTITPQEPMGSIRDTALKFGNVNANVDHEVYTYLSSIDTVISTSDYHRRLD